VSQSIPARAPVRVLVVENSAVLRNALIAVLGADPELTVIGWAADGAAAVRSTALLRPDVIAMDLRMPVLDGLETTRQILRETPTPIVLITTTPARDEQRLAFEALDAGVLAVLGQPGSGPAGQLAALELCRTLKTMARVRVLRRWPDERLHAGTSTAGSARAVTMRPAEIVAIGASTGGPAVLHKILVDLPADFAPPVLIVQHIAAGFADGLVDWLRPLCGLPIRIAVHDQPLDAPGIWVAPGGQHLEVRGRAMALCSGPPVSLHCPSATRLFRSVAKEYGSAAIGVLLTGMGDDGAAGLSDLRRVGATTIAQDEASSVVFSMPAAGIRLGVVDHVVPPAGVAPILIQRSRR
jgi:two-component system, chemotaxis family, protein-glutamate methylesterase/glutaminase